MDRNPDSPWNPQVSANISPAKFEELVLHWLRRAAEHERHVVTAEHLGLVQGDGGQYKVDVLVTFSAFGGAVFVVLVECKHQRRPVEREDVMVLESKLRDVNAQKAMLFSTSGFQSGAIEFATTKHIATIAVVEGVWLYETRAAGNRLSQPPPWVQVDSYVGIRMTKAPSAEILCHTIDLGRLDAIQLWLAEETLGSGHP